MNELNEREASLLEGNATLRQSIRATTRHVDELRLARAQHASEAEEHVRVAARHKAKQAQLSRAIAAVRAEIARLDGARADFAAELERVLAATAASETVMSDSSETYARARTASASHKRQASAWRSEAARSRVVAQQLQDRRDAWLAANANLMESVSAKLAAIGH